jgi:Fe-S oxidoreductase
MSATIRPDWEIRDAILDMGGDQAYACYQCGTCMSVCPWTQVETVVFPVYRMPQAVKLGAILASEDTAEIEREMEEVYRCVGCEACANACPHGVRMPDIVRGVRRILVEFGSYPAQLADAVGRIASFGNPFGEKREARGAWAADLDVPAFEAGMDYLYSPCCVPAYDPRAGKVARATAEVLAAARVSFGVLGDRESCCGEAIRRAGAEEVFLEVASANVAAYAAAGVTEALVTSPHCLRTYSAEYEEVEGAFTALHTTQLMERLLADGRLVPSRPIDARVTFHDPCALGRGCGIYEAPRSVLHRLPGLELVEIPHFNRDASLCCGGGSGGVWMERPKGERLSDIRVQQAAATGADILAVACPYCLQMFEDSVGTLGLDLKVRDVAELVADAL